MSVRAAGQTISSSLDPLRISSLLTTDLPDRVLHRSSSQPAQPESTIVFLQENTNHLFRLHMLHQDENIVLFTPAVAPPLPSRRSGDDTFRDPFEPFGRALAKHHNRIRHVPYVHEMTEGHLDKLRQAHAAIVVVCDASGAARSVVYDTAGSVSSRGSNLEDQVAFARAINRNVDAGPEHREDDTVDVLNIPVVLVLVTDNLKENYNGKAMKESLVHSFGADTVLHCGSYTTDALERIAERIFDEDVIDRARDREDSLGMELD